MGNTLKKDKCGAKINICDARGEGNTPNGPWHHKYFKLNTFYFKKTLF